jgi:hypothetical protein
MPISGDDCPAVGLNDKWSTYLIAVVTTAMVSVEESIRGILAHADVMHAATPM